MTAERFIPFRKASVVTMCADEVPARSGSRSGPSSTCWRACCTTSSAPGSRRSRTPTTRSTRTATRAPIVEPGPAEREAAQQRLVEELTALAEDANFERISADDLDRAFVEESLVKVRLEADFDDFEQVVFYRRGVHTREEEVKQWFGLRRRTLAFTNYAKVLVYVKFKDAAHFEALGKKVDDLPFAPGSMIIKLFQDVPRADLEMLFPNAQVRMRPIDKLLIGVPAVVSGIIMVVTKLVAALLPVLLLLAFWFGLRREPVELNQGQLVTLGAGLMAFGGFVVRQFAKFKNRKIQFMKSLSENLYFRNLDNDAGVFNHLLDAAEEEEVKEAVLAYHFLRTAEGAAHRRRAGPADRGVVRPALGREFDFEVADGVRKLRRLRLVDDDGQGRLSAVPLDEATRRLDETWDDLFAYNAAPRAVET